MVQEIRFGTDGWRGHVGEDYTFANVRRCTQGFASYLADKGLKDSWVVVGHDRRYRGEHFAAAVAEVLAGNGLKVYLTDGPTPTPVISYAVVDKKAAGAINITASHNPYTDNGFKVRDNNGGAIDPDGLTRIEKNIPDSEEEAKRIPLKEALEKGMVEYFNAAPNYVEHIKTLIDLQPIKDAGLRVLVDPMWGNGAGWFPELIGGGKTVSEYKADVLLINDGDADRVGIGDENGEFVDQLRVYALLAYYLLEVRGERGPIVKTLSTTTMLEKLGAIYDVPVYNTGVGFKYVAPKMLEVDAMIGGEESGGYAFKGNVPERDGILAGLYFLDFMVKMDKKPSELLELLFEKVGAHYYDRIDTPFKGDRADKINRIETANPETIGGLKVKELVTVDGYKFVLEDGGWLLIRFSGTEPIIRVYCETTYADRVDAILKDGLSIAGIDDED